MKNFVIPVLTLLISYSNVTEATVSFDNFDNDLVATPDISNIEPSGRLEAKSLFKGLTQKGWQLNLDPALNGRMIDYKTTTGWVNAIRLIEKLNPQLHIAINKQQKVLAVALSEYRLNKLNYKNALIWTMDSSKSLSENLSNWSKKSNIKIIYAAKKDYPVLTSSILFGKLEGKGNVIDKVLRSTKKKYPLSSDYMPNIPAIVIVDGGATNVTELNK